MILYKFQIIIQSNIQQASGIISISDQYIAQ